ncbi:hypothetical protein FB451DRAFT_1186988 [Mycena latifolia]|nr:hypothetical protein FB451DRAFT_1186988 [Mycena latifolia]
MRILKRPAAPVVPGETLKDHEARYQEAREGIFGKEAERSGEGEKDGDRENYKDKDKKSGVARNPRGSQPASASAAAHGGWRPPQSDSGLSTVFIHISFTFPSRRPSLTTRTALDAAAHSRLTRSFPTSMSAPRGPFPANQALNKTAISSLASLASLTRRERRERRILAQDLESFQNVRILSKAPKTGLLFSKFHSKTLLRGTKDRIESARPPPQCGHIPVRPRVMQWMPSTRNLVPWSRRRALHEHPPTLEISSPKSRERRRTRQHNARVSEWVSRLSAPASERVHHTRQWKQRLKWVEANVRGTELEEAATGREAALRGLERVAT